MDGLAFSAQRFVKIDAVRKGVPKEEFQKGMYAAVANGTLLEDDAGNVFILNAYDAIEDLLFIDRAVEKIIKSTSDAFSIVHDGYGNRRAKENALGSYYKRFMRLGDKNFFYHLFPGCRYSPNVELFFKEIAAMSFHGFGPNCQHTPDILDADLFNEFLDRLRKESRLAPYRTELRRRKELAAQNHRGLTNYVNSLFNRYSRILVSRLDLAYRAETKKKFSMIEVLKHKERLLNNIRKNEALKGKIIGYVMSLEFGVAEGGYHFHCFFFFDGSKCRQDISWSDMLGKYWVEKITEGEGCYYNCNKRKNCYKRLGIGMISCNDQEGRNNLLEAAIYITKKNMFFAILPDYSVTKKFRTFFRGEIQKVRSPLGRRRAVPAHSLPVDSSASA